MCDCVLVCFQNRLVTLHPFTQPSHSWWGGGIGHFTVCVNVSQNRGYTAGMQKLFCKAVLYCYIVLHRNTCDKMKAILLLKQWSGKRPQKEAADLYSLCLGTSSLKAGMRDLGLKTISTLVVPPRGSKVMGPVGAMDSTSTVCSLGDEGVKARWNVMAAGELLTIGTYFLTTSPT